MKLDEVTADERFLLEDVPCERAGAGEIIAEVGRLELHSSEEFMLRNRLESFVFRITDSAAARNVKDLLQRRFVGLATVSSAADSADKKLFCLRIIFFMRAIRFGKFQVILSLSVKSALEKKNFSVADYKNLAENFQFSDGVSEENCFAFVSALEPAEIPADDEDAETPAAETDSAEETVAVPSGKVFQLQGRECVLLVRLEGEGEDSHAVAYRAIFKKNNFNEQLALQLAYGEMIFSDEKSYVAAKVREILQETPNYLTTWNAYANREGDFLLKRARAAGTISYLGNFNHTEEGLEITVANVGKFDLSYVSVGDVVELRSEPPPYIADENMTWVEYQNWKKQRDALTDKKSRPQVSFFEVVRKDAGTLTLSSDSDLPAGGKLYFSINGDEKQIRRRTIARERIENGTSASPNLGLILGSRLEDSARNVGLTSVSREKINPRSALLDEKIFRNPPTVNQVEAINIALNTPDIAVIQGPPGTGKTTVITGILERLNEISNKSDVQPGQVLITSFQHDAVQNVIERISINSLPTIKFGRRASDEEQTLEDSTDRWLKNMLAALEEQHPQLRQTERERELFNAFNSYSSSPSRTKALNFLRFARSIVYDADLLREIDKLIAELEPPKIASDGNLIAKIYRLPTTPESFADGGQEIYIDLLNELENLYGAAPRPEQAKVLATLKKAAMTEMPDGNFFAELLNLKNQLLEKCKPVPMFEVEEIREEVVEIYGEIKLRQQQPDDAIENVVYELYREIRDNPPAMRQSIAAYTFAFAATVQQSEREDIKRAKNVENPRDEDSHAVYDTVIVDEAARVAPGDLMIPLSQAARRIILVGDQRQLPHIYDEEIFESLREDGLIDDVGDDIKVSMFEHLWNKAKELEKADGIKRAVTLDAQFRMHPALGNFVSRNFYEPRGQGFSSPRPASDFPQNIFNGSVCWVNVPANYGGHRRSSSRSLFRQCEVDYIAEKIAQYVDDPQNQKLTFGAISFYRAQAQAIKSKLKNFGSRVRIGTVDEFQGMEFDVMFLSVVRSSKSFDKIDIDALENAPPEEDTDLYSEYEKMVEQVGNGIYGFLTMENRLCVALSRQKRLLIVVGDAEMFDGEKASRVARICVPAMFNLYQLCKNEGGVINV